MVNIFVVSPCSIRSQIARRPDNLRSRKQSPEEPTVFRGFGGFCWVVLWRNMVHMLYADVKQKHIGFHLRSQGHSDLSGGYVTWLQDEPPTINIINKYNIYIYTLNVV